MGFEAIIAAAFALLILGGAIAGGISLYKRGKTDSKIKSAKEDAREATGQVTRRTDPVPTDRDYLDRLWRAKERLARLRDRATKRPGS